VFGAAYRFPVTGSTARLPAAPAGYAAAITKGGAMRLSTLLLIIIIVLLVLFLLSRRRGRL
jgi:hypothetical protein